MSIDLSEITRQDIIDAFQKYDSMNRNPKREAKDFTLFYNGKEYSHKYIVGIAYGLHYKTDTLDSSLYNSTGKHKASAEWCVKKNGFELFYDKIYKEYLEKNYSNKQTGNTYYSDLKKAIKIVQSIPKYKDKKLSEFLQLMKEKKVSFEEYDRSQKELGYNDKSLYDTLSSKVKIYLEAISKTENVGAENNEEKYQGNVNMEKNYLNQILYGPPGTGKTYHTINKALEVILEKEPNSELEELLKKDTRTPEERKRLKAIFDEYRTNGQIEFVTFHQSYGYEEFVEGIKAIPAGKAGNESDEMIYDVVAGIFKELSNSAKVVKKYNTLENFSFDKNDIYKMSLGGIYEPEIRDWCFENDYIAMGWGGDFDFSNLPSETNWAKFRDKVKEGLQDKIPEESIRFTIQAMFFFRNMIQVNDLVFVSNGNSKIAGIAQIVGDYEFDDSKEILYSQFRKVKWLIKDVNIPIERLYDRKFSQQTIYQMDKHGIKQEALIALFDETKENIEENYILIIDEINRGNISKIFGELITLIEPSKRIGADETLEIALPYSGEKFGVPKNLYIIGTMNTADRSIALMDTALRRRFDFIEMMPNPELLKGIVVEGIKIKKLFKTINKRIEYLYDRDHTIGHTYFMGLTNESSLGDLGNIFKNKIIPLLQEYFYDDWEKIRLVLGDNQKKNEEYQFIRIKNNEDYKLEKLFGEKIDADIDIEDETKIFEINANAFDKKESYIQVYYVEKSGNQ